MKKPGVQPLPGGDCRGLWFIYEPKWTDLVYNTMIVSATASVRATHCLSANLWTWPWCTQPPAKHPQIPAPSIRPGPAHRETEWRAKPLSFAFCFKAWSHSLPPPQTYSLEKFTSFVSNTRAMKTFYSYRMLENILETVHKAYGLPSVCRHVFTWVCDEPESRPLLPCIPDRVISEGVPYDFQHLLVHRQPPAGEQEQWILTRTNVVSILSALHSTSDIF
jgi:hypothetical protein